MFVFPKTTTGKELQQNYRKVFDMVKRTKQPVVVLRNNKPDVAIVDYKKLEELEAVLAVFESREEARSGKLKTLTSLTDLWHEAQKNNH